MGGVLMTQPRVGGASCFCSPPGPSARAQILNRFTHPQAAADVCSPEESMGHVHIQCERLQILYSYLKRLHSFWLHFSPRLLMFGSHGVGGRVSAWIGDWLSDRK